MGVSLFAPATQYCNQLFHVGGGLCPPAHRTPRARVNQCQPFRVQRLPRKRNPARAFPISSVADQGVAERRQMHAYLMGAPRFEATAQERRARKTLEYLVVRYRLAATRYYRHASALSRMTADRRAYSTVLHHL